MTAEAVTVEGAMAEARVEAEMAAAVMVVVKEEATCEGEQGHEKAAPVPTHVCVWARELQSCTRMEGRTQ